MNDIKFNDVSMSYKSLLDDLWRKGFTLISAEHYKCLVEGKELTKTELDKFYSRMNFLKEMLNDVKLRVHSLVMNGSDALERWRSFTSFTHPMRHLPRQLLLKCEKGKEPLLCTQAYCKFLQIAVSNPELLQPGSSLENEEPNGTKTLRSFHLCEAPGAFVLALKHCLANLDTKLDWKMNSLSSQQNDSFKHSASPIEFDDNFNNNSARMIFGPDGSGDILNFTNEFLQKFVSDFGKFHIITADAGIDCTDEPIDQERKMLPLIEKQLEIAFECLCIGGNFLIKIFTFFESETIQLLSKICGAFERVECLKPPSSKPGNSEIYLLCINFFGQTKQRNVALSRFFTRRIEECARFFINHQIRFIQFNLHTFRRLSQSERANLEIQKCIVQEVMADFLWHKIFVID
uniref:Cap-specific mRNA (nucleoside-2'-O-)-methyltransferase 2 n=1 Tax=Meloidogyne incognita TaxID=6306 RepID=A0A914KX05_MELIC